MASKNALATALVSTLLAAWTVPASGQGEAPPSIPPVRVEYVHPEKFTDVGDSYSSNDKIRASYLEELGKHLVQRAARLLSAGQNLIVSITEVDMAGSFEPWRRRLGDVRIVRDVYPPRIDLHFRLTGADGSVVKEGERKLRDLAFLMTTVLYRDDPLRYEKALIDDWLERELPRPNT
jgi:DUF3016 family protein